MSIFRLAYRDINGQKHVGEMNGLASYQFAREFVIREARAVVCLALVTPIEPQESPEPIPFDSAEAA
jgi:hypothetical protein